MKQCQLCGCPCHCGTSCMCECARCVHDDQPESNETTDNETRSEEE